MRPDVLAWSYGSYPYALVIAGATLIGSLRSFFDFGKVFRNPISVAVLVLQIPIAISVITALDRALAYESWTQYIRMIVMAVLILVHVHTERSLRTLLTIMAVSVGFLGLKFGGYGLLHGGVRYSFGYAGLMSDNNDLAMACAMTVPLCWYSRQIASSKSLRWFLLACIGGLCATVVMTHSRGGALSLGAALLLISARSRSRLLTLGLLILFCAPTVYLVKDTYFDRLATLKAPTEETSARSRLELAEAAFATWREHPMFGVGFGMRIAAALLQARTGYDQELVVHNTYMQMLVDSGVFAFSLYVLLLFGTVFWLGRSYGRFKHSNWKLAQYPAALQASLVAFAIGALSLSRVSFDMMYMVVIAAAAWYECVRAGVGTDSPDPESSDAELAISAPA